MRVSIRLWVGIAVASLLVSGCGAEAQPPLTPKALEGAWKLTSLSFDGVPQQAVGYMIFSGNYFSFVTTRERPNLDAGISRTPVEELTDEDKNKYVEAFRSMTAAAGPYRIEENRILYVREAVRSPHLVGRIETRPSSLEGNRLTQDFEGGGRHQVIVWERVAGGAAGRP